MQAPNLTSIRTLLDPDAPGWAELPGTSVTLIQAPLGLQPTPYLRARWADQAYGTVETVRLACAHDGSGAVFRLSWRCPEKSLREGERFADSAAIAFPMAEGAALVTMGSPAAPLHILQWQAGIPGCRSVIASGIGTSRPGPVMHTDARGVWRQGVWEVCFQRPMSAPDTGAALIEGERAQIGLAIWQGSNGERGGIKSFSPQWLPITLAATPQTQHAAQGGRHA